MTLAFKELSPANQDLLVENFVVGVSYGGAGAMPVPYSNTFALSSSILKVARGQRVSLLILLRCAATS